MTETETSLDLADAAREGIEQCRKGRWDQGYRKLCQVANAAGRKTKLPSCFYSYLGLGMARFEKRYDDGEKLCRRAIDIEFYETENYVNLAKLYGMRGRRQSAVETLRKGLQIDGSHAELREMMKELGVRKKPVLKFLSREHWLNRILGKIRHDLSGSKNGDQELD